MGRLIDIDVLFDYFGDDAIDETTRSNIEYFVSEKGTVEAIPKADYENRLKADMVAMLTDIQLEIEEKKFLESSCYFMDKTEEKNYAVYTDDISNIIQQKIDALKGEQEAADET